MQNVCQNHKQQQLGADEEKVLKRMMGEQPFLSLSLARSFLLLLRFSSVPRLTRRLSCHLAHHQCHVGVRVFLSMC